MQVLQQYVARLKIAKCVARLKIPIHVSRLKIPKYVTRLKFLYLLLMATNCCAEVLSLNLTQMLLAIYSNSANGCPQSIATDFMEIVMMIVATASTQRSGPLSL